MSVVQERYRPVNLAANVTVDIHEQSIGGFLAKTAGVISVRLPMSQGAVLLVDAIPVTAGVYTPIPAYLSPYGGVVTLADGASGTLFV